MTTKELLNLSPDDVSRMTFKELRSAVSQISSAANKRFKTLGSSDVGKLSPQYAKVNSYSKNKYGGAFGVGGKNLNQLRNEYKRARDFMNSKTGSVRGWYKVRRKVIKRLGGEFPDISSESRFWDLYRKFERDTPDIIGRDSTEVQRTIYRSINMGLDDDDTLALAKARVDELYEEWVLDYLDEFDEDDEDFYELY